MREAYAGDQVAKRETQVRQQLTQLEKAVQSLDNALATLHPRLEPVLRQAVPTPIGGENSGKVSEVLCQVAEEIRAKIERIRSLTYGVESATERLEL